ncbi:hypothetical protein DOY81_012458 [Sarcophaga bullata]|nr:hypothetical protein DOY81_012458 [Sarcophaga bullata]
MVLNCRHLKKLCRCKCGRKEMINEYDPYGPNQSEADQLDSDEPETMPRLFQAILLSILFSPYITLRLGVNPTRHPKRLWLHGTIPLESALDLYPYDGEEDDISAESPPKMATKLLGLMWETAKRRTNCILQRPDEQGPLFQ